MSWEKLDNDDRREMERNNSPILAIIEWIIIILVFAAMLYSCVKG